MHSATPAGIPASVSAVSTLFSTTVVQAQSDKTAAALNHDVVIFRTNSSPSGS
jgi:hypothetical protein